MEIVSPFLNQSTTFPPLASDRSTTCTWLAESLFNGFRVKSSASTSVSPPAVGRTIPVLPVETSSFLAFTRLFMAVFFWFSVAFSLNNRSFNAETALWNAFALAAS